MSLFGKNGWRNTLIAALLVLTACGQPPVVPMEDQSIVPTKKTVHIAGSGDTLYSIAFLSGLDYKNLAAWNNISEPYIIRRGQKISLVKPETLAGNGRSAPVRDTSNGTTVALRKESAMEPSGTAQQPANTATVKTEPATARLNDNRQNPAVIKFDNSWAWPISASNIVNYKRSAQNSGLDIISHFGVDVKASASGKVVYAGNGLKGYGNLVIIKHDDAYLSAYAHNRSIYVKEGDYIAQGQKIAEVGSSDANQAKLHFEIRKSGTPISPLGLLPKKIG